tara:strand:+ start:1791 stop:2093 length:303 start_codon:yes stop_codon:yes gene_type:complete
MTNHLFAFEFKDGRRTTEGSPNKHTGNLSIAGQAYMFWDDVERDSWVVGNTINYDKHSDKRIRTSKQELRSLHQGMSVSDYENYIDSLNFTHSQEDDDED